MSKFMSPNVKSTMDKFKNITLQEATYLCLNDEIKENINLNSGINKMITKVAEVLFKSNHKTYLFADSTAVQDQRTIVERAKKWSNEGFILNGCKYQLNSPFEWNHPKGVSRNHRYKIQAWIMIDELLRASLIKPKSNFLEISRNISIDWIEQFLFGNRIDDFSWYDMGTGQRASLLAYITHQTIIENFKPRKFLKKPRFNFSEEKIMKLIIAAEIHLQELMCLERLAIHSNHGLFQMAGLLALSSSLPMLKSSRVARNFAIEKIELMLEQHFFDDGFHKEHSPMYHMFMSNYLFQLSSAGWINDSINLKSLTKKSIQVTQKYIMPNGYFTPLGDSNLRYDAASLCLFEIHKDARNIPSTPPGLHLFKKGGVVILATNDSNGCADEHLVFSAQFHSRQHKHADDLTINYCIKGKPYLIDSGTFTYQYDQKERMYIESTKAHNTIEIDGMNNSRFRLDAYGSGITKAFQIGSCTVMEAKIKHKNLVPNNIPNNQIKSTDRINVNISHKRILINKPNSFLTVIDIIDSDKKHQFSQWFHFDSRLALDRISDGYIEVNDTEDNSNSAIYTITQNENETETMISRGESGDELIGWHSINGLELEPNYSLETRVLSKSTVIATVFDFNKSRKVPFVKVSSNGRYIRFSMKGQDKFDIIFRDKKEGDFNVELTDNGQNYTKIID